MVYLLGFVGRVAEQASVLQPYPLTPAHRGWYIGWGLWVGLQNRIVFCLNHTIYQKNIYSLGFVCVGLQNWTVFCSYFTIYQKTIYGLELVRRVAELDSVLLIPNYLLEECL